METSVPPSPAAVPDPIASVPGDVLPVAAPGRRILILANPIAGTFKRVRLDSLARRLSLAGHDVDVRLTRSAGDIAEIVARDARLVDVVVIAGGDGSVNEALTGLAGIVDPPAIAILPFGTANVLALEVGMPRRARPLARLIDAGATMPLHFGIANDRAFVLMASAGFDAAVVHALRLGLKRRLGKAAYALAALKKLFAHRDGDLIVTANGVTRRARLAVATNVSRYGGPFVLASDANPAHRGVILATVDDDRPLAVVKLALALALGRVDRLGFVRLEPAEHVRIASLAEVPAQIDGDPFGMTPLDIRPAQRPVKLIVPEARASAERTIPAALSEAAA